MRILWATPFNVRSAIGRFSRDVCEELARRGHQVVVQRTEIGEWAELPTHETALPVRAAADMSDCSDVDLAVFNLGNHAPYHFAGLGLFAHTSPLVVFHDAEMRDFAWGAHHHVSLDVTALARRASERTPTPCGGNAIVPPPAHEHLALYASMSAGAVVHGQHYADCVASHCPGRLAVFPLSYPDIGAQPRTRPVDGRIRVVIFGMITRNKQPDRLLRAIGRFGADAGRFDVRLAGAYQDSEREYIESVAREAGVAPPHFAGQVSDAELCAELADADLICCLRWPVSEGGSASLATALYSGTPVIVNDVASYALVPDGLVRKVSYSDDPQDLAEAIRGVVQSPAEAIEAARRAREWANEHFSSRSYADSIEPELDAALRILPWLQASRRLAADIRAPDGSFHPAALESAAASLSQLAAGLLRPAVGAASR